MNSAQSGSAQPTTTPVRPSLGSRQRPSDERVEDRVEVRVGSARRWWNQGGRRGKAIPSPGLDVLNKQQHQVL
ncbi:hypothetical protein HaLaN_16365, partial [Haematococcus lacustris]